jgi:hypothetical protein
MQLGLVEYDAMDWEFSDGNRASTEKAKRYSARSRSMKLEEVALKVLKPLLLKFGGHFNLQNPD